MLYNDMLYNDIQWYKQPSVVYLGPLTIYNALQWYKQPSVVYLGPLTIYNALQWYSIAAQV